MNRKTQWKEQLLDIVRRRKPDLMLELRQGLQTGFTGEQVAVFRGIVGDELAEKGMTDGELNEWGLQCDDLIDKIGPL